MYHHQVKTSPRSIFPRKVDFEYLCIPTLYGMIRKKRKIKHSFEHFRYCTRVTHCLIDKPVQYDYDRKQKKKNILFEKKVKNSNRAANILFYLYVFIYKNKKYMLLYV